METMSIAMVKEAYQPGEGRHWFDPSTMRFFKTRFCGKAHVLRDKNRNGIAAFFVTSEQPPHGPRVYNVRQFTFQTRNIGTVKPYGEYKNLALAREAMHTAIHEYALIAGI